jgi:hypothetical protein
MTGKERYLSARGLFVVLGVASLLFWFGSWWLIDQPESEVARDR